MGVSHRRNVRYELMLGREATEAIAAHPVGYLPVGCLERHGDHLPMGLDVIKAHGICCEVAATIPVRQLTYRHDIGLLPQVRGLIETDICALRPRA